MPTTYTPVPGNAPATYTLPSDLDDADAESVNLTFRAAIDNLMGLTALLAQQNTFTAGPLEVDVNDSTIAALVTRRTTDDDSHSGNKWKAVLGFALGGGGGSYVNVYAGKIGGAQQFAIVLNAVWSTSAQNWSKDNTGADSIALLMSISGSVQISRKAAGTGTWTDWPTDDGVLNVDTVSSNLVSTGTASASGGFYTPGSTGDFNYAPVKLRNPMPVPLSGGTSHFSGSNGEKFTFGDTSHIHIPLRLPENAGGCDVEIMFNQSSSAQSTYRISRYDADWTTPGSLSETDVVSATTPAVSGYNKLTLTLSSIHVGSEYRIVWVPGAAADNMVAARVTSLNDNGPRNTF